MMNYQDLFDLANFEHVSLFEAGNPWDAIKRLPDYLHTNATDTVYGNIHPTAVIMGNVVIGPRTVLGPYAIVSGPTVIGSDCFIGRSLIRDSLIGSNCVVGHACEVARSILLGDTEVSHNVFVGDSVLGGRVNIGGGTHLSNFKLNGSEILVKIDKKRFQTGLKKLGAFIGDGCKLGAMCQTSPGTVLSKGCLVWSGARLFGWYPPNRQVKIFQTQEIQEL